MKKLIKINLLLLLIPFNIFSQTLEIDWGASFDSKSEVQKILGFMNGNMYAFSMKGKNYYIDQFNEDGYTLIASNEYEVPKIDGYQSGLLNIAIANDEIIALVYGYSKKTKSFILYAQMLDDNGKQKGRMNALYESEEIDGKIKDPIVDVRFSPNNKKLLVFFDRTDKDRFTFYSDVVLVDLSSSELNTTSDKLTFIMRDMSSEKSTFKVRHDVENDGSYYFMNQKIEFDKKTISSFQLEIIGYNGDGKKIGNTVLEDAENMLLNPAIVQTKDGYSIVGYYQSNPRKRAAVTGYAGIFIASLDQSLGLTDFKKNQFSNEFFTDLYSQRKIDRLTKKGDEILVPAPYSMDRIVLHSDGTMTVISEYFLVTVMTGQRGSTTTTTNYGNIIYYKINTEGELTHSDVIKKNQVSSTTSVSIGVLGGGGVSMFMSFETKDKLKKYWSYAVFVQNDIVYLMFNDHRKNEEDEDGEISRSLGNPKQGFPYLAVIDTDGSFTKSGMSDANDSETFCVPQVTFSKDAESFVIWGVKRKENKFGNGVIQ